MSENALGKASSANGDDEHNSTACPTCGRDDFATRQGMKAHHSKIHNESLAHTVDCDWCGVEFERRPAVAKQNENNFCSNSCRGEWLSENNTGQSNHNSVENTTTVCKNCNEEFEHKPYIDRTFCDIDCRNDYKNGSESNFWKGGKVTKKCVECGCSFEVHPSHADQRKHCSNDCLNRSVELECEWCGSCFSVNKSRRDTARCCSQDCWAKLRATFPQEQQPAYKGADKDYDYGPNWYPQRRKARKRDHYSCQICGRDERQLGKIPSCHHITKLRHYRKEYDAPEWYERGNRLENLILLCEDHHKKWEGIPLRPMID